MFRLGYALIVIGIIYGIYANHWKHRINLYIKSHIAKVTNEKGFFRIQFWLCISNSLFLVIAGIFIIVMNPEAYYAFGSLIVFHIINYSIVIISSKLNYIERAPK